MKFIRISFSSSWKNNFYINLNRSFLNFIITFHNFSQKKVWWKNIFLRQILNLSHYRFWTPQSRAFVFVGWCCCHHIHNKILPKLPVNQSILMFCSIGIVLANRSLKKKRVYEEVNLYFPLFLVFYDSFIWKFAVACSVASPEHNGIKI